MGTTCITFTLFTLNYLDEFISKIDEVMKKLEYTIERRIVGLHSNAKREHYHIAVKISYSKNQVKHLNRKLTPLLNEKDLDYKISFYHNDDPKYDETKPFMYPLKEHQNKTHNETLHRKYAIDISEEDFKSYLLTSSAIYDKILYEKKQKDEKQIILQDTTESKYKYLDTELFNIIDYDNDTIYAVSDFKCQNIENKLKSVCKTLLKYQKIQYLEQNKKCFKIGALMDLAISYLYFRNLVSEDELLDYKYRI